MRVYFPTVQESVQRFLRYPPSLFPRCREYFHNDFSNLSDSPTKVERHFPRDNYFVQHWRQLFFDSFPGLNKRFYAKTYVKIVSILK